MKRHSFERAGEIRNYREGEQFISYIEIVARGWFWKRLFYRWTVSHYLTSSLRQYRDDAGERETEYEALMCIKANIEREQLRRDDYLGSIMSHGAFRKAFGEGYLT